MDAKLAERAHTLAEVAAIDAAQRRRGRASCCRRSTSGGWQNFKANRRGYWSLWIFLVLFVLTLFAELIANDRPLLVSYKGELLFPVFHRLSGVRSSAASSRRPTIATRSSTTRSRPTAG